MTRIQLEKGLLLILATVLVIALAGCQTLGTPPVDTFGKRVIVANAIAESAASTAEQLFLSGRIDKPRKDAYVARVKDFATGIDLTQAMEQTNPQDANSRLVAIIAGLNALSTELDNLEHP